MPDMKSPMPHLAHRLPRHARQVLLCVAASLGGCTYPMLVEGSGPSAKVVIRNQSSGYVNVMTYRDPRSCDGTQLVGRVFQPWESRDHQLPAGPTTLSVGAWGLSLGSSNLASCKAIFVSTKLVPGQTYFLDFVARQGEDRCGVRLLDGSGEPPPVLRRQGSGGMFPGVMAGPNSCEPDPAIDSL